MDVNYAGALMEGALQHYEIDGAGAPGPGNFQVILPGEPWEPNSNAARNKRLRLKYVKKMMSTAQGRLQVLKAILATGITLEEFFERVK